MAIGDVLRGKVHLLTNATRKRKGPDSFWVILRDIAREEIIFHDFPVDSDVIIPIYYDILSENLDCVPEYFQVVLPSNHQERFRVVIRNMFSSNSFHEDGLAKQPGIYAYKQPNQYKKGERVVFQKA